MKIRICIKTLFVLVIVFSAMLLTSCPIQIDPLSPITGKTGRYDYGRFENNHFGD
ncbi:MAG: hypothetical protein JXR70_02250 [Spirochaetales bacterium]|nr:hypothetical protein [Spirochaetales bacterium]